MILGKNLFSLGRIAGILIAAPLLLVGTSAADASPYGVLGLYQVKDQTKFEAALTSFESQTKGHGCKILREGKIVAKEGEIDIFKVGVFSETPDHFVLLSCEKSLLSSSKSRALFRGLESGGDRVALLEGDIMMLPGANSNSAVQERSYIFKVSIYNNEDPDGRDRDLAALGKATASRPDKYQAEAVVMVSRAIGMPTPDEVTVLYYDSPEAGERFRNNNADIMDSVNAFNDRHLIDYVYYMGAANR